MYVTNKVLSILQTEKYVVANEVRGHRVWEWQCDVSSFDPSLFELLQPFAGRDFFFNAVGG